MPEACKTALSQLKWKSFTYDIDGIKMDATMETLPGRRLHNFDEAFVESTLLRHTIEWNDVFGTTADVETRLVVVATRSVLFRDDGGLSRWESNSYITLSNQRTEEENASGVKAHLLKLLGDLRKSLSPL